MKLSDKSETVLREDRFFFSTVINLVVGREICKPRFVCVCCIFEGKTPRTTRNAAARATRCPNCRDRDGAVQWCTCALRCCTFFQRAWYALITKRVRRVCFVSAKTRKLEKKEGKISDSSFSLYSYDSSQNLLFSARFDARTLLLICSIYDYVRFGRTMNKTRTTFRRKTTRMSTTCLKRMARTGLSSNRFGIPFVGHRLRAHVPLI